MIYWTYISIIVEGKSRANCKFKHHIWILIVVVVAYSRGPVKIRVHVIYIVHILIHIHSKLITSTSSWFARERILTPKRNTYENDSPIGTVKFHSCRPAPEVHSNYCAIEAHNDHIDISVAVEVHKRPGRHEPLSLERAIILNCIHKLDLSRRCLMDKSWMLLIFLIVSLYEYTRTVKYTILVQ